MTSLVSSQRNSTDLFKRAHFARRFRAPLLGRSVTPIENVSPHLTSNAVNDSIQFNKRRFGVALFGRYKWMGPKRKGPLFG